MDRRLWNLALRLSVEMRHPLILMRTLILFLAKEVPLRPVQQRMVRTTTTTVTFRRPFSLPGADRMVPAGDYRVVTDEELIEGLSFPAYHRVSTAIFVPGTQPGSWEMLPLIQGPCRRAGARPRGDNTVKSRVRRLYLRAQELIFGRPGAGGSDEQIQNQIGSH